MTIISDLSPEMVDEILSRIPLTSLQAVRSTSKQWNASSKQRIVCKARARDQFLGFMNMGTKVCSVRFQGELEDLSIKQVANLNQFYICQIFHCDGLLLCVSLNSKKLVIWNPYLNQTRIIEPTNPFSAMHYGIGYDSCRRYKILRFRDFIMSVGDRIVKRELEYEIYDLDSNSWRSLDVSPDWDIKCGGHHGVSLKGSSYWIAENRSSMKKDQEEEEEEELRYHFLVCFDYTRERFRSRLKFPVVKEAVKVTGRLSCVREEKLAVLFQHLGSNMMMEIWMTTKLELDDVSWSKFLVFDTHPRQGIQYAVQNGSFFIDEDKKIAMLFSLGLSTGRKALQCNTVYIIGENGYYKEVDLEPSSLRPILCSYVPSLVQIRTLCMRQKEKRNRGLSQARSTPLTSPI